MIPMSWNYRIVKTAAGYGIHEVYYDAGKPKEYTRSPVGPVGDSPEAVTEALEQMLTGAAKPFLTKKDFRR